MGGKKKQMGKKTSMKRKSKRTSHLKIACGVQLQKWGESRAEALRGQCPVEHRGEFSQLKWPNWTTSGDLG